MRARALNAGRKVFEMTDFQKAVLAAIIHQEGITHHGLVVRFLGHSTHEINDACVKLKDMGAIEGNAYGYKPVTEVVK